MAALFESIRLLSVDPEVEAVAVALEAVVEVEEDMVAVVVVEDMAVAVREVEDTLAEEATKAVEVVVTLAVGDIKGVEAADMAAETNQAATVVVSSNRVVADGNKSLLVLL